MLDWLIIGGGPHGVHLANCLLDRGLPADKLEILDPNDAPLAQWKHNTDNTGMTHLRSPKVHNIGVKPLSLEQHAQTEAFILAKYKQTNGSPSIEEDYIRPYARPSLRLFMHHADSIIHEMYLEKIWKKGRASSINTLGNDYRVQTKSGESLTAKNVVLALGMSEQLYFPEWAKQLINDESEAKLHHIFSSEFKRKHVDESHDVIIVGAGISSAQLALSLLEANPNRRITIISRHSLRKEDFDSDPGWLGPKYLTDYHREKDYGKRRAMIQSARKPGSLSAEVMLSLQTAIKHKKIIFKLADIEGALFKAHSQKVQLQLRPYELDEVEYQKTGEIISKLSDTMQPLEVDVVVLGTGFESRRPGGALIDNAIEAMNLPIANDGFPIVDEHLKWREGFFVMGALAELEVGPVARNISGAQMAAERIMKSPEVTMSVNPTAYSEDESVNKTSEDDAKTPPVFA